MSFTILGTGSALPPVTVTNADLSTIVDTSDEWIASRTGMHERRVLGGTVLEELAADAAMQALARANLKAAQIDRIFCTTVQGDFVTPSLASAVAGRIGAQCAAIDLNGACAGFVDALELAAACFESGRAKRILIVSAEAISRLVDWNDRSTCVLFGDGAGAVVAGAEGSGEMLWSRLRTQPNCGVLFASGAQGNCPFGKQQKTHSPYLRMNGQEVYKFAVRTISEDVQAMLRENDLAAEAIDWYLLHQPNLRILEAARMRLRQPEEKFPTILARTGNISSACLPVLLDEMAREGRLKEGQLLFLSAFGAGLVSASCLLRWGK